MITSYSKNICKLSSLKLANIIGKYIVIVVHDTTNTPFFPKLVIKNSGFFTMFIIILYRELS